MKKIVLTLLAAVGIPGLIASARVFKKPAATVALMPTSQPSATPSTTTAPSATTTGQYKNGQFTGQAVDIGYGTVQVEAIISGGKLTDVQFLQAPSGGHSGELAAYAEPILRQEAIQAQSASVDVASGATSTSEGFQQSLGNALSQAA